jgi:hypothetical protein
LELVFADLVRLPTLSPDLMGRKENKKAIGYEIIVYFIQKTFLDVTTLTETLSFNEPNII